MKYFKKPIAFMSIMRNSDCSRWVAFVITIALSSRRKPLRMWKINLLTRDKWRAQ